MFKEVKFSLCQRGRHCWFQQRCKYPGRPRQKTLEGSKERMRGWRKGKLINIAQVHLSWLQVGTMTVILISWCPWLPEETETILTGVLMLNDSRKWDLPG